MINQILIDQCSNKITTSLYSVDSHDNHELVEIQENPSGEETMQFTSKDNSSSDNKSIQDKEINLIDPLIAKYQCDDLYSRFESTETQYGTNNTKTTHLEDSFDEQNIHIQPFNIEENSEPDNIKRSKEDDNCSWNNQNENIYIDGQNDSDYSFTCKKSLTTSFYYLDDDKFTHPSHTLSNCSTLASNKYTDDSPIVLRSVASSNRFIKLKKSIYSLKKINSTRSKSRYPKCMSLDFDNIRFERSNYSGEQFTTTEKSQSIKKPKKSPPIHNKMFMSANKSKQLK